MKKFLKNIVYFGLIVFLVALGLEFYLTQKLINRNSEGEIIVWKDLYGNGLKEYDHFIYGSSRAWVHIDPFILEEKLGREYYNLGANGQNFTVQKFRHEELEKRTQIKSIIYSVDVFTLISRDYIHDYYQFLPFMFWEENRIGDFLKPYGYYSFLDYYLPLTRYFGHRELISSTLFSKGLEKPPRVRGYMGQELNWNDDLKNAKEGSETIEVKIDDELLKDFDLFLKECKLKDIEIVLVYSPEFIDGQNFVSNRSDIIDIYKGFSEKYKILFLDFSSDSINLNRNYFYNASHLNKAGAEIFTRKLADSLNRIWLN